MSAWRHAVLGGAVAGLGAAPYLPPSPLAPAALLSLAAAAAASLALAATKGARHQSARHRGAWHFCLALAAATVGLVAGDARVAAIDHGAFAGTPGERVSVRGVVTGVPRPQQGLLLVPVDTPDGRLVIEAPPPERDVRVGGEVRAEGVVREPAPWQAGRLRIGGVARIVATDSIDPTGRSRGGVAGALDDVRDRAEAALERGVPGPEAELARGFVLGQDDRIDAATVDDFRRSGLAHLLAVSGQNVLLLALLAMPVLALLGVPLRARLVTVIALIAIYVPVTGAGPSIQRAAVMGAAGIVAVLAGRPSRRVYALLLAAAITLVINPRAASDVGWQLSFAAVVGILFWARPLATLAARGRRGELSPLRRGLADGIGVTVAATLATAPISAAHFETVSLASLPANLLALPAVAPVMWLGMLAAALGQVAAIPVEPLNWLCSLLVAYIAQVAHWFGTPGLGLGPGRRPEPDRARGPRCRPGLSGRRGRPRARPPRVAAGRPDPVAHPGGPRRDARDRRPRPAPRPDRGRGTRRGPHGHRPRRRPGGRDPSRLVSRRSGPGRHRSARDRPPGAARRAGRRAPGGRRRHPRRKRPRRWPRCASCVRSRRRHVVHAGAGRELRAVATAAGAETRAVAAGDSLRVGALRLRVLWPPPARGRPPPGADPNLRSIVVLASWHRFDALLTGDAEAEAAPTDPGPLDLLKVAHHGSEDTGLPALLERTDPALRPDLRRRRQPVRPPAPFDPRRACGGGSRGRTHGPGRCNHAHGHPRGRLDDRLTWKDGRVRTIFSSIAALIIFLIGLVMLILMLNVSDLPLCGDGPLRGADECIEASSEERVLGLVAGWASVLTALFAVAFAIRFAARGTWGFRFALTAGLTPVLALLAVAFLPVSF